MKKIIITGPESTGKTTLTQQLAKKFSTAWVPEFARTYLENLKRPYREDDLLKIAKGQQALENFFSKKAKAHLFCDTSMLVLKIWSEHRFGKCAPWILEQLEKEDAFYILCQTDVPWEFDPQREHPNEREGLYQIYQEELRNHKKQYIEISGNQRTRLNLAIKSIHHDL